jgi:hypothetical protein
MKRFLFFLFTLSAINGYAQIRFFEVYDFQTKEDFGTSIAQIDSFYFLGGVVDSLNRQDKISIMKIKKDGEVEFIFRERFSNVSSGGEIIWDVEVFLDKILICGQFKDSIDNAADGL